MSTTRRPRPTLRMESLENRELMAADIQLDNGRLSVEGTDSADVITVDSVLVSTPLPEKETFGRFPGQLVRPSIPLFTPKIEVSVTTPGGSVLKQAQFDPSDVNSLAMHGLDGDDSILNDTDLVARIYGGDGHDTLHGGGARDYIYGQGGNDLIFGNGGDDHLVAGHGNDEVDGGVGDDRLYGQWGDDVLLGGFGNDYLSGSYGDDILEGGAHDDRIYGSSGNDVIKGGSGDDYISAGTGDDLVEAGSGGDLVYGGSGDDRLYGGSGADSLYGQSGDDGLFGGSGVDYLSGSSGDDRYLMTADPWSSSEDTIALHESNDARINFVNGDDTFSVLGSNFGFVNVEEADWADSEIVLVDEAFHWLVQMTGNTTLLEKAGGGEMTFVRQGAVTDGDGNSVGVNGWNGLGTVTLVDNGFSGNDVRRTVVHEIGHNWDEEGENSFISDFREESGWEFFWSWQSTAGHTKADDNGFPWTQPWGAWYFDNNAEFARTYGEMNPLEDFATSFTAYVLADQGINYFGESPSNVQSRMADKFAVVDDFFATLG